MTAEGQGTYGTRTFWPGCSGSPSRFLPSLVAVLVVAMRLGARSLNTSRRQRTDWVKEPGTLSCCRLPAIRKLRNGSKTRCLLAEVLSRN